MYTTYFSYCMVRKPLAYLPESRLPSNCLSAAICRIDVQFERQLRWYLALKVFDRKLRAVLVTRVPLKVFDHLFEYLTAKVRGASTYRICN